MAETEQTSEKKQEDQSGDRIDNKTETRRDQNKVETEQTT